MQATPRRLAGNARACWSTSRRPWPEVSRKVEAGARRPRKVVSACQRNETEC
ncbi:hypothetical protein HMPREF0972_02159 [Actinomyces sp. oral taxon 848 str. F0332]|nr:hypothetical protein HMPREF0972_02159 [Actinomyces sp. oral taxon 848 str. F0332]